VRIEPLAGLRELSETIALIPLEQACTLAVMPRVG